MLAKLYHFYTHIIDKLNFQDADSRFRPQEFHPTIQTLLHHWYCNLVLGDVGKVASLLQAEVHIVLPWSACSEDSWYCSQSEYTYHYVYCSEIMNGTAV